MGADRAQGLDLLELAEEVAAGRRTLDNVIDQIAVATPDDGARRRAVAEVQTLIVGLAGVRGHAAATRAASSGRGTSGFSVSARRVQGNGRGFGRVGAAAGAVTAVVGIVAIAVLVASLRPTPSVGGPSPSAGGVAVVPSNTVAGSGPAVASASGVAGPSASGAPAGTSGPSGVLAPTRTAGATAVIPEFGDRAAFWTHTETSVTVWTWAPLSGGGLQQLFTAPTYDIPAGPSYTVSVLASPDGSRFAVNEHAFGDPASHDRVRVFDASGAVLWTSPDPFRQTIDMAWSADSSRLALGALHSALTVLTFASDGSAKARTYPLTEAAYRLLGFSTDGRQLIGYDSVTGVAFWQQPAALDIASGAITLTPGFPAGISAATTGPIAAVDEATGDVLALGVPGLTPAGWQRIRDATALPVPTSIDPAAQVAWASDGTDAVVWLVPVPGPSTGAQPQSAELRTGFADAAGDGRLLTTIPTPTTEAVLASVHDGVALIAQRVSATYPSGDPGWATYDAVALAGGSAASILSPAGGGMTNGLWFAGWIGPSGEGPTPTPTALPSPSVAPTPTISPAPSSTAAVSSGASTGLTFWSIDAASSELVLWTWQPPETTFTERTRVPIWPTQGSQDTVLVAPVGGRFAVVENSPEHSPDQLRTRVFSASGDLLWTSPTAGLGAANMAWSTNGTRLAITSTSGPWTIVTFGAGTTPAAREYSMPSDADRMLGFSSDGSQLIGYDSSGTTSYLSKPIAVDLLTGDISSLDFFPPGMVSNATTGLGGINPDTGDVLGHVANGWNLTRGTVERNLSIEPWRQAIWADASTIAVVGPELDPSGIPATTATAPPNPIGVWATGPGLAERLVHAFPGQPYVTHEGSEPVDLVSARFGDVLVDVGGVPCCLGSGPTPGYTQVSLVDLSTGETVDGTPPGGGEFGFAGWLSAP